MDGRSERRPRAICRNYRAGNCKFGGSCHFLHSDAHGSDPRRQPRLPGCATTPISSARDVASAFSHRKRFEASISRNTFNSWSDIATWIHHGFFAVEEEPERFRVLALGIQPFKTMAGVAADGQSRGPTLTSSLQELCSSIAVLSGNQVSTLTACICRSASSDAQQSKRVVMSNP
jgi:hypothetical protein